MGYKSSSFFCSFYSHSTYVLLWLHIRFLSKINLLNEKNGGDCYSKTEESGTRPPVIGYTNWWKSSIGRWINESFQSGMGSKTTQTFRLTERIKMTYP